ncbi:MAG: aminotransferase class IV [Gemmatales bacterium]
MPPALSNLNGKIMPLAETMVPALDRGFLFGDAVYEGMHAVAGKTRFIDKHFQRLERSLKELRIGPINMDRLRNRLLETIAAGPFQDAFIYVQITRGAGPTRSHAFPPEDTRPNEFLFVETFTDPYEKLRDTGIAAITQPDLRWHRCDVKSTNLLGNVLAFQAAKEKNANEAILIRPDGTVTEGTRTSLFGVVDGKIRTGQLSSEILPGVTRSIVIDLIKKLSLPFEENHLLQPDLPRVTELFLTGTTSEVLPISTLDGKQIGDGRPGQMTKKLQAAFRELVSKDN